MTVSDAAIPNPYGLPWPSAPTSFTIGSRPAYAFSDQISPPCQQQFCRPGAQQVQVLFSGPAPEPTAGGDWAITSSGGVGDCDSSLASATPMVFPITIGLPPTCRHARGVDITVVYKYLGQTITVPLGPPVGTPATTTTSTSTSTTSTTTPPASTTASSSTTTSSSTTAATAAVAHSDPPAELAAAHAGLVTPGDAEIRNTLEWGLLLAGVWGAGMAWRARRRRKRTRS